LVGVSELILSPAVVAKGAIPIACGLKLKAVVNNVSSLNISDGDVNLFAAGADAELSDLDKLSIDVTSELVGVV
jgi:hypothetical protein